MPVVSFLLDYFLKILARNVLGLEGANSTEFCPDTPHPVITIIDENEKNMGLGSQKSIIVNYGTEEFWRHRHRYEFNMEYLFKFMRYGFEFLACNEEETKIDIVGVGDTSIGVQFHPEYTSRPHYPDMNFRWLIQ